MANLFETLMEVGNISSRLKGSSPKELSNNAFAFARDLAFQKAIDEQSLADHYARMARQYVSWCALETAIAYQQKAAHAAENARFWLAWRAEGRLLTYKSTK